MRKLLDKYWSDNTGFLRQFEPRRHAFIATLYYYALVGGNWSENDYRPTKDLDKITDRVQLECQQRMADIDSYNEDMRLDCEYLFSVVKSELSYEYARSIIRRKEERDATR